MARNKISEHKAKQIIFSKLRRDYPGLTLNIETSKPSEVKSMLSELDSAQDYVLKVDQAVKKRAKQGLIALKIKPNEIAGSLEELAKKGYVNFVVEEFLPHSESEQRYLAIERVRSGLQISYAAIGGVDIEDNAGEITTIIINYAELNESAELEKIAGTLGVQIEFLQNIVEAFQDHYFSFLEINPLVVQQSKEPQILDLAVEVDSVASFFSKQLPQPNWDESDFMFPPGNITTEVTNVKKLDEKSQASLKLQLLNPNGAVWLLLSGGGASIVLADEFYNLGKGEEIGNYGEYSGNPNADETYIYTKNVLALLLKSGAQQKVLVIAGGVANFTDVRKTFIGLIKAMKEYSQKLQEAGIKVFVRRGGPHQDEGLQMMEDFLQAQNLLGEVHGPELTLTDIAHKALDYIKEKENA
jgi:succinyl-CoA synthetase beta subunit